MELQNYYKNFSRVLTLYVHFKLRSLRGRDKTRIYLPRTMVLGVLEGNRKSGDNVEQFRDRTIVHFEFSS